MKVFVLKSFHFLTIILNLVKSPPFVTLSIFGNAVVFFFAGIVYFLEEKTNPLINSFMDALWWSFSTTTTIGYGDIVPQTFLGKIVGITLMLVGVALFSIYTAIFARAILDNDTYME